MRPNTEFEFRNAEGEKEFFSRIPVFQKFEFWKENGKE